MDEKLREQYTIAEDERLFVAVQKLSANPCKGLVVMRGEKAVGTFTRADMIRCSHLMGRHDISVGEYACRSFHSASTLEEAGKTAGIHALMPVVNGEGGLIDIYLNQRAIGEKYYFPVVVMAGGKGTRLFPYTRVLPKPLVPVVDDIPMVELVMNQIHRFGPEDFTLIVNHKKEMIEDYFRDAKTDYRISFVEEENPLGTGGGLGLIKDSLSETFCLTNCDILMTENMSEIYEYHLKSGNDITVIAALMPIPVSYGVLKTDERQKITDFVEKPVYLELVNIGIYFVNPDVLQYIEKDEPIDFPDVMKKVQNARGTAGVYPITNDRWMDMGQVSTYEQVREKLKRKYKEIQ